jgi:hypothetical protein
MADPMPKFLAKPTTNSTSWFLKTPPQNEEKIIEASFVFHLIQ